MNQNYTEEVLLQYYYNDLDAATMLMLKQDLLLNDSLKEVYQQLATTIEMLGQPSCSAKSEVLSTLIAYSKIA
jgi:hypothetical protein